MHIKFEAVWIGHYQIQKVIRFDTYIIKYFDKPIHKFPVNGNH